MSSTLCYFILNMDFVHDFSLFKLTMLSYKTNLHMFFYLLFLSLTNTLLNNKNGIINILIELINKIIFLMNLGKLRISLFIKEMDKYKKKRAFPAKNQAIKISNIILNPGAFLSL